MEYLKYYILSLFIVVVDQVTKLLVHLHMKLGEEIMLLGEWFRLHYVQNPGIAFGLELDIPYGKFILTMFRILAVIGLGWYMYFLANRKTHRYILVALTLILAGALGNVIDSTLYGVILDNAPEGAFTPWFHGQVIDMFYFPIFYGTFPDWLPIWGSQSFQFFRPVFNLADASIFIGVAFILILQDKHALIGSKNREVALKTRTL